MKTLLAFIISFIRNRRKETDAQVQRFERLEIFLLHCTNMNYLQQYDHLQNETLLPADYRSFRFRTLMVRYFSKRKQLAQCEQDLQEAREMEGNMILKMHGL